MKQIHYLLGVVVLLLCSTTIAMAQVSNDNEDEVYKVDQRLARNAFVPGQVLIKFKSSSPAKVRRAAGRFSSSSLNNVDAVLREFNVDEMEKVFPQQKPLRSPRRAKAYNGETVVEKDLSQIYSVSFSSQRPDSVRMLVDKLKALPEVEYAEPNYKAYIMGEPSDDVICEDPSQNPLYSQQWGIPYIGVDRLWTKPVINSERPIIAIIDTGVDVTHPALADNCIAGWDFVNNTDKMADYNSHGTHVAGIAAACDNGVGIVGANPRALIMPITVMHSDGSGDIRTIAQGVEYAAEHGATIINMSLGTAAYSQLLRDALEHAYQTAILVAAAGNDGKSIYTEENGQPIYPGAHSFVLGVMAHDVNGQKASFSNYDPDGPTFSNAKTEGDPEGINYEFNAPGVDILSTVPNGNYRKMNGTSMATPLVAGAISALQMIKKYDDQKTLWGDLLHSDNNIAKAYDAEDGQIDLDILSVKFVDADGKEVKPSDLNAGETYSLYPAVRATWGETQSIKLHLSVGDNEDSSLIDVTTNDVDFGWSLSPYGWANSKNALVMTVSSNSADARHLRLKVTATCDESHDSFSSEVITVINNMIRLSGDIEQDMTLNTGHTYYIDNSMVVAENVKLTIEPGVRVEFAEYAQIVSRGIIISRGTPEAPIVFTSHGNGMGRGVYTSRMNQQEIRNYYYTDENRSIFSRYESEETPLKLERLYYNELESPYSNMAQEEHLIDLFGKQKFTSFEQTSSCTNEMELYWLSYESLDDFSYCIFDNLSFYDTEGTFPILKNCIVKNCPNFSSSMIGEKCNFINNTASSFGFTWTHKLNNYINNQLTSLIKWDYLSSSNYVNNVMQEYYITDREHNYSLAGSLYSAAISHTLRPSYFGSGREDIVRSYIQEEIVGATDLSNMLLKPVGEAHGIVWKVVVNGYDAQDEFNLLPPLGVGKHKFEIFFNRPMNKNVAPKVSFGVRSPYTQHSVNEEGSWNEEGTVYTVYATITGKTQSDGLNRIYVSGAEDNEYFECPYENTRFNINIQAAGSLSAGFFAESGMGKVTLQWDDADQNTGDVMGYNIYRIHYRPEQRMATDEHGGWIWDSDAGNWKMETIQVPDTISLTQSLLPADAREYIDYDVLPGTPYSYYYTVMSTDMSESGRSHTVSATPLTSILGDANGSGDVDVADVISIVNYASNQQPKPFIYEAADINTDQQIDILDIIGVVQKILNPDASARIASDEKAVYTVEDGVLYIESPVALAGVQAQLTLDGKGEKEDVKVSSDLTGFEHASAWLSDNDYLFLAYSMNGKMLGAGKHALLYIGDADVNSLRLSDAYGHNVTAIAGNTTAINRMGSDVMNVKGIYTLGGQKLSGNAADLKKLPKGVYIINGEKIVK